MTALIIVIILAAILVGVAFAGIGFVRQFKVSELLKLVKIQKSLILKIEKEAMSFGMADPLANVILSHIHDARSEENK
jgi:hypothetical protein